MILQVPQLQRTDYLSAGWPAVAAVFVFDVAVTVAVQHATADVLAAPAAVFRSAVAVALCVVAAAELAVVVSAVEMFVIGALVVHVVAAAAVVAGPQALLTAFAKGHCFVVD